MRRNHNNNIDNISGHKKIMRFNGISDYALLLMFLIYSCNAINLIKYDIYVSIHAFIR